MNPNKLQKCLDAVQIGRVLLTEPAFPLLEAFSGNALYCGRGMPTMKKYKTVKEVCALTGLTGKHLYYFHHERVVRAVAYANYSVEGNDGYKLYDDAAVEKLQQIALYYQLGLKRNEIRNIMLDPNYDSNLVLETLLALEQAKKLHIERHIAALEYLTLTGTKNGIIRSLQGMTLEELGETLLTLQETSVREASPDVISQSQSDGFFKEFFALVTELSHVDSEVLNEPAGEEIIRKIFDLGIRYIGADGCPFILGMIMSALGDGSVAQQIRIHLSPVHGQAVIRYLLQHPELHAQGSQKQLQES